MVPYFKKKQTRNEYYRPNTASPNKREGKPIKRERTKCNNDWYIYISKECLSKHQEYFHTTINKNNECVKDDRKDQNYKENEGATRPTAVNLRKLEQRYKKEQREEEKNHQTHG